MPGFSVGTSSDHPYWNATDGFDDVSAYPRPFPIRIKQCGNSLPRPYATVREARSASQPPAFRRNPGWATAATRTQGITAIAVQHPGAMRERRRSAVLRGFHSAAAKI